MSTQQKLVLLDIDYTLFDTDHYRQSNLSQFRIYDEIESTLEELGKISELGIFSEGEKDFQHNKLKKTNLMRFFKNLDHIHIMVDKLSELKHVLAAYINTQIFVIDDKLSVLHMIKKHFPKITVIWLKRGKYAQVQKPIHNFTPDAIIISLKDAVPIVSAT